MQIRSPFLVNCPRTLYIHIPGGGVHLSELDMNAINLYKTNYGNKKK